MEAALLVHAGSREEADRLGIDSLGSPSTTCSTAGYLPQPLTFASAVAARARRARIGTAVLVAPLRPAAQIAEEAAIVDLVSGGRLDLGLGTGYRPPEFDLYGASIAGRYGVTDSRARDIRAHWESGKVLPPPAQDRLPIWMGYQGPKVRTAQVCARRGPALGEPQLVEPTRRSHRRQATTRASARMAGALYVWATDGRNGTGPPCARHVRFQNDSHIRRCTWWRGTDQPVPPPVDPREDQSIESPPASQPPAGTSRKRPLPR
ncbi:LLM class flavin-dependent oxidoreductase [Streptomyces sp. KL116D]|uniref:LLM class flavin-dependent oxidoreductase n=1 Tax=Streptomyces sp. KL116D TaxID=3045152 RepID=UPI003557AFE3